MLTVIGPVLLKLLIVVAYVFVPGAAFLAVVRFRFSHTSDAILACIATGIAWTAFWVYVLLLANAYSRSSAALIILVPALRIGWAIWNGTYAVSRVPRDTPSKPAALPLFEQAAVVGAALLILLAFVDASTSPITAWDADISWDKWATDWGRRSNSYGYLVGGYPQMLPMFSSVLYKLTGAFAHPIPLEQYVLHAMHPLFGLVLLAGIVRLSRVLKLPSWPSILMTFGNQVLQVQLSSGAADLLLVTTTILSTVLFVTYLKGLWNCRFGFAAIVGPALFGVCFTKANGFTWLLLPVSYLLIHYLRSRDEDIRMHAPARTAVAAVLLPVIVSAPFFIYQVAAAGTSSDQLNTHEMNFSVARVLPTLAHVSAQASTAHNPLVRVADTSKKILESFLIPTFIQPALIIVFLLMVGLSVRRSVGATLLIPLVAGLIVWYWLAAYDVRNILNLVPIAGVLGAMGAAEWQKLSFWKYLKVPVAVLAGAFIAIMSLNMSAEIVRLARLWQPDHVNGAPLRQRLVAMDGDFDAKVRLHFPMEFPVYSVLTRLPVTSTAPNLLATAHLYRWFPNGAYPLSDMLSGWGRDRDLWIGMRPLRPPRYDAWTMLYETPGFRVWIMDTAARRISLSELLITGATPQRARASSTALDLELDGAQRLIAYNVPDRNLKRGSFVVWRALVESRSPDSAITSGFLAYDPNIVDITRTTTAVDAERAAEGIVAYSGLITFVKPVSPNLRDGILVGILSTKNGGTLRVRAFQVSVHP